VKRSSRYDSRYDRRKIESAEFFKFDKFRLDVGLDVGLSLLWCHIQGTIGSGYGKKKKYQVASLVYFICIFKQNKK
jgi:hypothetical protein